MSENLKELVQTEEPEDKVVIDITSTDHVISSDNSIYELSLRRDEIEDEKELKQFIKSCEKLFRLSPEYKLWTGYVREVLGYVKCDLTSEVHGQMSTDIHHHPISLYTITKAIIMKKINEGKEFCSLDIVIDLVEMHYELNVGFIILIKSLHEKFHNGFLQLPMEVVKGHYKHFLSNLFNYLDDDSKEIIEDRLAINLENCGYGEQYYWTKENYPMENAV